MRTFVALEIPGPAKATLGRVLDTLKDKLAAVRFTRPENLHVTLRFFGPTPPGRVDALTAGLASLCETTAAMDVPVGGIGFFPGPSRPRVIFVRLELPRAAFLLQERCEALAVSHGFDPETRPFRPHLTLGRIEGGARFKPADVSAADVGTVRLERVVFFRSDLRPGGAVHTPIAGWTLPAG